MKSAPNLANSLIPYMITLEYPEISKHGFTYLDMWPVSEQMIVVSNPDLMAQFTQDPSLPKHRQMPFEFGPFTHGDLVTSNGQQWKTWRSIFSPGFSSKQIQSYVPDMIEEYRVFKAKLDACAAKGDVINMDKLTMRMTVDIIGHAVLGASLHAQTTGCAMFDALKRQIGLLVVDYGPEGIIKKLNPLRPFQIWSNNRIMRKEILPYILRGIQDHDRKEGTKSMHSLAVKSYRTEHSAEEGDINDRWIDVAVDQFKMLLFAGHDTVSSTFCFVTGLLHYHPEKLAKLRAELDDVLGKGSSESRQARIAQKPEVLNQLTYLTAVIKETLRLYGPVSGSVRQAGPDQHIYHHKTGEALPIWDLMLFAHQAELHRDETYWPRPHEFIPERFTAKEGDELYPHKNTYRPFELGQRNCIGQEFAMTELRLVLALILGEMDFAPQFDENGPKYFGSVLYQTCPPEEIVMHPRDGMPMKVLLRKTNA
jgi:cytochrome P450